MPEDDEIDPGLVDAILRWQRGEGPRPEVAAADQDLLGLLLAVAGSGEVADPPIEDDPVAILLGLPGPTGPAAAGASDGLDPILVSLHELAHRLAGELDVEAVTGAPVRPGGWQVRARCRTLGEIVVVVGIDGDDLIGSPERVAPLFTERPATTAVALVSTRSLLAVVVGEADCVTAIDPVGGWAGPALPRQPEPLGIALGRHLDRTRPRWDEIARLDEMLVLAPDPDDVAATVGRVLAEGLGRPARIPAKRAALASLDHLSTAAVVAVVDEVRTNRLRGDDLLGRIRRLAEAGA